MYDLLFSLGLGIALGFIIPIRLRLPRLWPPSFLRARSTISSRALRFPSPCPAKAAAVHSAVAGTRQTAALHTLRQIRSIPNPTFASVIHTLRRINPYVFEDLVLLCLAERGVTTWARNTYSHDGGVDGWATINGRAVVIQAKRWRNHIRHHDIRALHVVATSACGVGLFIHTGRTGRMSRVTARRYGVNMLSGRQLCRLVLGAPFELGWHEPSIPRGLDSPLPSTLALDPPAPAGSSVPSL